MGRPAASSRASLVHATVVLPLVPVMPTITSSSSGRPWRRVASGPRSARGLAVTSQGTVTGPGAGAAATTATAPRPMASVAKVAPS